MHFTTVDIAAKQMELISSALMEQLKPVTQTMPEPISEEQRLQQIRLHSIHEEFLI